MKNEEIYAKRARKIIKTEMLLRDVSYRDLSQRLREIGVYEVDSSIKTKINRGRFSLFFFLQVTEALGIKSIDLQRYSDIDAESSKLNF